MNEAAFIYHPDTLRYRFNDQHPFNQERLRSTLDLLYAIGALSEANIVRPRTARERELAAVHIPSYIEAVKSLSLPIPPKDARNIAKTFGLHTDDTPYFAGMHEAASVISGGTLTASELVMTGKYKHALHLGGGLHHAFPNKASGFCIYNDAAIAISWMRRHYDVKVLYVDTDVHHGDGVQMSFYTDPHVCTFSIHETGKFLFPGTGFVNERGAFEGYGTCFNMPVEPYTEDESWLECFQEVLEKVVARFKPDVIVSQHGCDAHFYDPLSHIHCSMKIYEQMPKIIHSLAHQWCDGRWVALGGGGYDIWRVVPRAWSLLWLVMTDHSLLDQLNANPLLALPEQWLNKWQKQAPVSLPPYWLDRDTDRETIPRKQEIEMKNKQTLQILEL